MNRKQIILTASLFAALVTVLTIAYFVFLRPDYSMLYDNVRESDVAAIVEELDRREIAYRLGEGGHAILVPADRIDEARVAIAGSEVALGGVVGFELFNESDMGLTDFAQKINYQRALQGELARTIMMMDGIAFARVHLALPERALFRNAPSDPKAGVTIQTKTGTPLLPKRVSGVQQLVANAVNDLTAGDVAVLDAEGQLLSTVSVADSAMGSASSEQSALESYFRARALNAADPVLKGVKFDINVVAQQLITMSTQAVEGEAGRAMPDVADRERDFALRVTVRTTYPLPEDDRLAASRAVVDALGLELDSDDRMMFQTGPLGTSETAVADVADRFEDTVTQRPASGVATIAPARPWLGDALSDLVWLAMVPLAILLLILIGRRRRLSEIERQSFADLLGEQLVLQERAADVG